MAFPSKVVILRCNSLRPLYLVCRPRQDEALVTTTSSSLWHRRLGHPGHHTMSRLQHFKSISYNKDGSP
uniref:GAG-pre-integrase domain-containing protein n=1 Tax=Triticum urartu TaxID=4572 RepID=A0A8R7TS38_TRIUA